MCFMIIRSGGWDVLYAGAGSHCGKSSYDIYDENQQQDFSVNEENPLIKVFDGLFDDIPILGMFTGYFFNPTYLVTRPDGTAIARLSKKNHFSGAGLVLTNWLNSKR